MDANEKALFQNKIENLKHHLTINHPNLASIKVFENVGEHPFVIKFIQFNDYDLNLTLQINQDFKLINSTLITNCKHQKYTDKKLKQLEDFLKCKLRELDGFSENFLSNFFDKTLEYVEKNFTQNPQSQNEIKAQTSLRTKHTKESSENNEVEKKCSMKTANDVVNRIQWDEEIVKDFIIVGYMDRFLGLKECTFNTFDWGDIVLAELGALAIPEHRITYFKYKNELIWDKTTRLDNVFGSTGSNTTIRDVIKRLENNQFEPVLPNEQKPNKIGRPKTKTDDGPNFFVSIPIKSAELNSNMFDLNCDLLDSNHEVENFLVPDTSTHITVCTLRINTDEEMQVVKNEMQSLRSDEEFLKANFPINLKFRGVGEFFNKVFYIKCETEELEKLENLKKSLLQKFRDAGVSIAGNLYEFVPHLTVFKIKSNRNTKSSEKSNREYLVDDLVNKFLWKKYENFNFGQVKVKEIELCKMVNIYAFKSYPVEHSINVE